VHDIDNYRGLAVSSNGYSVYSKVLEENIMAFLEDNNILRESKGLLEETDIEKIIYSRSTVFVLYVNHLD
jgi:hypothetical protein